MKSRIISFGLITLCAGTATAETASVVIDELALVSNESTDYHNSDDKFFGLGRNTRDEIYLVISGVITQNGRKVGEFSKSHYSPTGHEDLQGRLRRNEIRSVWFWF